VDRFRGRKCNEEICNIRIVFRKCLLGIGQIYVDGMDFVPVTLLESINCFGVFGLSTNEKRRDEDEKDEQREQNLLVKPLHGPIVSE
jgi:hypothetical protein